MNLCCTQKKKKDMHTTEQDFSLKYLQLYTLQTGALLSYTTSFPIRFKMWKIEFVSSNFIWSFTIHVSFPVKNSQLNLSAFTDSKA